MGRVPNSIAEAIFDLLALLVFIVIFPFTLIILSPFYLWRLIVKLLAKFSSRLHTILSELDVFFLVNDPRWATRPEFVISILVTIEGEVNFAEFRENISNDIVNARHENGDLIYTRLQQSLTTWLGFPFFQWIQNFSVSDHVKMADQILTDDKHQFMSTQIRQPFPADGALWDVTLAPSTNKTFVNLRIHHVVCDGFSILKTIMTRGMKINPNEFIFPTKSVYKQEACYHKLKKIYRRTFGLPGKFIRENLELKRKTPFQNPHSSSFSGKVLMSSTGKIPLHKFKRAKLRLGVPFTAILNASISAALRNFLQKVESERANKDLSGLADTLNGVAFVPLPKHPNDAIINWCGIADMKIPLKGDSLDTRLEIANAQFKNTVSSPYPIANYYFLKVVGILPLSLAKCFLSRRSTGFLYSNMPGPTAAGHLWPGNFMSDVMFWDPVIGSNGLAFSILSYNEYVKIGIAAESHVTRGVDNLREMTEFIEAELEKIFNLDTV